MKVDAISNNKQIYIYFESLQNPRNKKGKISWEQGPHRQIGWCCWEKNTPTTNLYFLITRLKKQPSVTEENGPVPSVTNPSGIPACSLFTPRAWWFISS